MVFKNYNASLHFNPYTSYFPIAFYSEPSENELNWVDIF